MGFCSLVQVIYHFEVVAFFLFGSPVWFGDKFSSYFNVSATKSHFDLSAFLLPAFGWYILKEMLYCVR